MTSGDPAGSLGGPAADAPEVAKPSPLSAKPAAGARPLLPRWVRFVAMPFFGAAAVAMAVTTTVLVHDRNATPSVSPVVALMGLSDLHGQSAPGFTLTDQHGRRVSLSSLHGKAVLLTFVDVRCRCSALTQELRLADHDLGSAASKAALVAVNVDPADQSVEAAQQFTQRHGLGKLANWYFLTGTLGTLRSVWDRYDVKVVVPKGATQAVHTDRFYFIDERGDERYVAEPQGRPGGTRTAWGQGMATYLEQAMAR